MKWKEELFKENDIENSVIEPMSGKKPWATVKTNLPKSAPNADLTTFLNGSLNCILGADLNKTHTNLPECEKRAMNELIKLQKSRQICIKPNDKTGGCSVLNTTDYVNSLETLLSAKHTDSDGFDHPYFQKLDPNIAA